MFLVKFPFQNYLPSNSKIYILSISIKEDLHLLFKKRSPELRFPLASFDISLVLS